MINEPLGLPRGSVRSVLAILMVTATICLAFAGALTGEFATLSGVVISFYFAGRGATPAVPIVPIVGATTPTPTDPQTHA